MDNADRDSAWVTIDTPWSASQLFEFASDLQRLFRLNPYLEIQSWETDRKILAEGQRVRCQYLNEMNGVARELTLSVSGLKPNLGFILNYSEGLKRATEIIIEPKSNGAVLMIKDWYDAVVENPHQTPAQRQAQLKEVDRSLTPWGAAIRRHILGMARWGQLPFYRAWRERFWLPMPPRNRRISRLIIWTTALEFVVFILVFSIYWTAMD
ncbi:MAG: hypothetical protein HY081_04425 [Gammaproteobacteria bacterium]|nr:hypothetical protein [Gammaproteobacteria bacterium]